MVKSFAIIGLGNFGFWVAKNMNEYRHQTVVIDIDKELVQRMKPFVTHAVVGDATAKETLVSLGLNDMDAVIVSMGEDISASCLVTLHLHEIKVRNIVVKAVNEDHAKILKKIGATRVVFPEKDLAIKVARELMMPNLMDFIPLSEDYEIVEIAPSPKYTGKSLMDLQLPNQYGVQVIAIKGLVPENFTIAPKADFVVKDSDILIILGRKDDILKLKEN